MVGAGAQAVIGQGFFDPHRARLIPLAAKHRVGYMSPNRETTLAGALVSLSSDYVVLYEKAATFVDKILKGIKPVDLPVEQAVKFQVAVNLQTARQLGCPYHLRCSCRLTRWSNDLCGSLAHLLRLHRHTETVRYRRRRLLNSGIERWQRNRSWAVNKGEFGTP